MILFINNFFIILPKKRHKIFPASCRYINYALINFNRNSFNFSSMVLVYKCGHEKFNRLKFKKGKVRVKQCLKMVSDIRTNSNSKLWISIAQASQYLT